MVLFPVTMERKSAMPSRPVLFVNGVKPCSICGESKSPEQFNKDSSSASGYASRCKACQRLYKLKRGDTIHELREKRVGVKLVETMELRKQKDAELEAKRQARREAGLNPIGRSPVLPVDGKKNCSSCKTSKSVSEFYPDPRMKSGYTSRCKMCCLAANSSPDAKRLYNLAYKYGITPEQFDAIWKAQDGKCAICHDELSIEQNQNGAHLDHCHRTGKVRGLLCQDCNHGLGKFDDNIERLSSAINYLVKDMDIMQVLLAGKEPGHG